MIKNKSVMLYFDLETMPNLVRTWRKWEQNVIWYERHGYIWSISYSYDDSSMVYHKNITDFPLYKKDKYSDKELVEFIWDLVDKADVCIAHNGNAFDLKTITGRFVHWGLKPPRPYKKIDTKLLYKKYLNEDSNSLKDIAEKHNLPLKKETGGYELWKGCEEGDQKCIKKMAWYNNGDVVTLKAAYKFIRPYDESHPNVALLNNREGCKNCGSAKIQHRGFGINSTTKYQRVQCQNCGAWGKGQSIRLSQLALV